MMGSALLYSVIMLVFLNFKYSFMWTACDPPQSVAEVDDPALRLVNRVCGSCLGITDRVAGEFVKPEAEVKEPGRTFRLLQNPVAAIMGAKAADLLDVLHLPWLSRAKGSSLVFLLVIHSANPVLQAHRVVITLDPISAQTSLILFAHGV